MKLKELNDFADRLTPTSPAGITHKLTTGNLLSKDWWVPMPPAFFPESKWRSLDMAMASALDQKVVGTGPVFIDIAHLGGWKGNGSNYPLFSFKDTFPDFTSALKRVFEENESVVIRYLEGNTVNLAQHNENGHGGNNVVTKDLSSLIPLDRRDKVNLYFANITMDIKPSSVPGVVDFLDALEG